MEQPRVEFFLFNAQRESLRAWAEKTLRVKERETRRRAVPSWPFNTVLALPVKHCSCLPSGLPIGAAGSFIPPICPEALEKVE